MFLWFWERLNEIERRGEKRKQSILGLKWDVEDILTCRGNIFFCRKAVPRARIAA